MLKCWSIYFKLNFIFYPHSNLIFNFYFIISSVVCFCVIIDFLLRQSINYNNLNFRIFNRFFPIPNNLSFKTKNFTSQHFHLHFIKFYFLHLFCLLFFLIKNYFLYNYIVFIIYFNPWILCTESYTSIAL